MSQINPAQRALTVNQFIEALGISLSHFYDLQREGQVRTILVGTKRLIPADELDRILATGTQATNDGARVRGAAGRAARAAQARKARTLDGGIGETAPAATARARRGHQDDATEPKRPENKQGPAVAKATPTTAAELVNRMVRKPAGAAP
jgi:excisionase family DNA binding protein